MPSAAGRSDTERLGLPSISIAITLAILSGASAGTWIVMPLSPAAGSRPASPSSQP